LDFKNFQIKMYIMEIISKINNKDMVFLVGKNIKFIKEIGKINLNMDLVYGLIIKETITLDIGKTANEMDMDFIIGKMEIFIKVNFLMD